MEIRINTYKELAQWSKAFIDGSFGLFFLIGSPGHAKSYNMRELVEQMAAKQKVERAKASLKAAKAAQKTKSKKSLKTIMMTPVIDKNYQKRPDNHMAEPLWIKGGNVSAFKVYQMLYTHLDELVIFDDTESVYTDRGLVRLLKAVCESEEVKEIGWHTDSRQLEKLDIPLKFKTRSRIAIIANTWKTLTEHVGSLLSRGIKIDFRPSVDEVIAYIKTNKIVTDKQVMAFVDNHKWMATRIDIRDIEGAVIAKKAKLPWEEALATSMGIRDMMLVTKLEADTSHHTGESRVSEFMRQTGQSRPLYFKAQLELKEARLRKIHSSGLSIGTSQKSKKSAKPERLMA